ncbi:helix-turn-helix domain-containing protein [Nonomuraea cavernae]|uniref:helix-turn-helix domain-containing protein n=1 Tax=Nonomuraea cavernae TaxID=2045107 RepID=UPI001667A682|nr:helix-turn-helix domain-containing protein [Nonomuraea cavernae]MCA2187769.1 helix-turn-helix domain-containing protein [Nonomuraea cavernae]
MEQRREPAPVGVGDLAAPRLATCSISVIAARWGFTRPEHFSQAFRGLYGLSPHQFLQQSTIERAD